MKNLSVVIPVYNEEDRLQTTFKALEKGFPSDGIHVKEIIFVNDGSTDNTATLIRQWIATHKKQVNIRLISYKHNYGKGYAVRKGLLASISEYILFMDADISTPLAEFTKMMPAIERGIDIVIGTRKNGHSTVVKHQPLYREILGKGFTYVSNIFLNTWISDFTCGFKIFSRSATKKICSRARINRWGYDAELMFLATRLGCTIQEVPVQWSHDEDSKVRLSQALPQTIIELFTIRRNHIAGFYRLPTYSKVLLKPAQQWITTHLL